MWVRVKRLKWGLEVQEPIKSFFKENDWPLGTRGGSQSFWELRGSQLFLIEGGGES